MGRVGFLTRMAPRELESSTGAAQHASVLSEAFGVCGMMETAVSSSSREPAVPGSIMTRLFDRAPHLGTPKILS